MTSYQIASLGCCDSWKELVCCRRAGVAAVEAHVRADERQRIAEAIDSARDAYVQNIRKAAGLGDAAPLVNVASQYADGMRRAAEIARGGQP